MAIIQPDMALFSADQLYHTCNCHGCQVCFHWNAQSLAHVASVLSTCTMERDNARAHEVTWTDHAVHATITLAGVAMAFRRDVSLYAPSILQKKCVCVRSFVRFYVFCRLFAYSASAIALLPRYSQMRERRQAAAAWSASSICSSSCTQSTSTGTATSRRSLAGFSWRPEPVREELQGHGWEQR